MLSAKVFCSYILPSVTDMAVLTGVISSMKLFYSDAVQTETDTELSSGVISLVKVFCSDIVQSSTNTVNFTCLVSCAPSALLVNSFSFVTHWEYVTKETTSRTAGVSRYL